MENEQAWDVTRIEGTRNPSHSRHLRFSNFIYSRLGIYLVGSIGRSRRLSCFVSSRLVPWAC